MNWFAKTFSSVAGRKLIAALTGLGLVAFLVLHLLGNLQIFMSGNELNDYAKSLHDGPLIILGDVGLLVMFPLHIIMVIWLVIDNKKARGPESYRTTGSKQKRGAAGVLASKMMPITGLGLMAFVIAHVLHFRLRHGEIGYDLKSDIIVELQNPIWGIVYIIGSLLVSWHLFHGFQAAFRTLGTSHPRYMPMIQKAGVGLSVVLALGFTSIPVWILLQGGQS